MNFEEVVDIVSEEPLFETGLLLVGNVDAVHVWRQLSRWNRRGHILQLRRGLYVLAPPWRKRHPHPFLVANRLAPGSYVSGLSALAFAGAIPEYVAETTSVAPGRPELLTTPLGRFSFRHVKDSLRFGYRQIALGHGQTAFVAEPEKAILDMVHLNAGGDRGDAQDRPGREGPSRHRRRCAGLRGGMKDHLGQLVAGHEPMRGRNIAREYLQARILGALQRAGAMMSLAFHGGTSLRFLFGLPRYCEDLDFALEGEPSRYDLRRNLRVVRAELSAEGYRVELHMREHRTVHSVLVRFLGTLDELGLSPHPGQVLAVKIEIDTNPPAGAATDTTLVRRHETLRPVHHDRASLLAGRVHAVLQRPYTKGRDLYDLVWCLSDPEWPPPNLALLNAALRQTGWTSWTGIARRATCGRFWSAARTSSWSTGAMSCGCWDDRSGYAPISAAPPSGHNSKLHSQRPRDPHYRGEGGVAVFRQCLVQPLAAHPDLAGEPAHVPCPRDVVQGGTDQAAVARILLRARLQVEARIFPCAKVPGYIPFGERLGHVCLQSSTSRPARSISRCWLPLSLPQSMTTVVLS